MSVTNTFMLRSSTESVVSVCWGTWLVSRRPVPFQSHQQGSEACSRLSLSQLPPLGATLVKASLWLLCVIKTLEDCKKLQRVGEW